MYLWRLEQNSLTWLYLTVELYIFIADKYMVKFEWLENICTQFWRVWRHLITKKGAANDRWSIRFYIKYSLFCSQLLVLKHRHIPGEIGQYNRCRYHGALHHVVNINLQINWSLSSKKNIYNYLCLVGVDKWWQGQMTCVVWLAMFFYNDEINRIKNGTKICTKRGEMNYDMWIIMLIA